MAQNKKSENKKSKKRYSEKIGISVSDFSRGNVKPALF